MAGGGTRIIATNFSWIPCPLCRRPTGKTKNDIASNKNDRKYQDSTLAYHVFRTFIKSEEIKKGAFFKALPFIEFVNRLIFFIIKPYVMCTVSYIMV